MKLLAAILAAILLASTADARTSRFPELHVGPGGKWAYLCFDGDRTKCQLRLSRQELGWLAQESERVARSWK